MANAIYLNTYKLKKGSSVPDFLKAVEDLFQGSISKHEGYAMSKIMADGDTWADYIAFETMEGLNAFLEASKIAQENGMNELAEKFYSFINFSTCKSHIFSVEKYFYGEFK